MSQNGGNGMIAMVFQGKEIKDLSLHSFHGGNSIVMDWGDGSMDEFKTVTKSYSEEEDPALVFHSTGILSHEYGNNSPHTVTARGNIRGLYCEGTGTPLGALDVSRCPALKELDCHYNSLTALDVSLCSELTFLDCSFNHLISLDIGGCTKLEMLNCSLNQNLNTVDISRNTRLTCLDCSGNGLTALDISRNPALSELWCTHNELTEEALNRIFNDLSYYGKIYINGNPGTDTCDKSIARKKGWDVISSRE